MDRPRLLLVRRGALGDTLLLLPLLRWLRTEHPDHELWLAGVAETVDLVAAHGLVQRASSVESLRLWRVDGAAAAQAALARELATFAAVIADVPLPHSSFVPLALPRADAGRPAARQILTAVTTVLHRPAPDPPPPATLLDAVAADPDGDVVLHPGAGSRAKCWPAARYAELAHALRAQGRRVLVVVGEAELERGDDLAAVVAAADAVLPAPPLEALAARLARARAFVGNDSGVTHLAAALRVPTVAVFGPTDPRVWAPDLPWVRVVGAPCAGPPEAPVAAVLAALAPSS